MFQHFDDTGSFFHRLSWFQNDDVTVGMSVLTLVRGRRYSKKKKDRVPENEPARFRRLGKIAVESEGCSTQVYNKQVRKKEPKELL